MYKLTKIGADGAELPADATDHQVVRVDRALLAAPIFVTAHRSAERLNWEDAKKWAEGLTINGWSWRLPTAEEAFLLCDRSRTSYPMLDPEFFPDCDGEWIWTGTEDLVPPAGYAWVVNLGSGFSSRDFQVSRNHVRAVRSGQ